MATQSDFGDTVVVRRRVEEPVGGHSSAVETRSSEPIAVRSGPAWPVYWSAIWVGGLTALTVLAVLSLVASAIGYGQAASHATNWADLTRGALVASIFSSLIAFFVGGFMAVKVSGLQQFEAGVLHGAIVWLVALPFLMILGAVGVSHLLGYFSIGIVGAPAWINPAAGNVPVDVTAARAASNVSTGALFAILMGLVGGLLGGWLGTVTEEPAGFRRLRR